MLRPLLLVLLLLLTRMSPGRLYVIERNVLLETLLRLGIVSARYADRDPAANGEVLPVSRDFWVFAVGSILIALIAWALWAGFDPASVPRMHSGRHFQI